MNPWIRGFQIVTSALEVIVGIGVLAMLVIVLRNRKRFEERIIVRPYRELPWKRRWIMIAIGVSFEPESFSLPTAPSSEVAPSLCTIVFCISG